MSDKYNIGSILQSASLLIGAIGLAVGAWQYLDKNQESYRKEIWTAQKALYEQAISAASTIATGEDVDTVEDARKNFWNLYWGKLAMLESPAVETAMIKFGKILGDCERSKKEFCFDAATGNAKTELQIASLHLAHCARQSLLTTWRPVELGDLKSSCPYKNKGNNPQGN